jgi:hypothetical protein
MARVSSNSWHRLFATTCMMDFITFLPHLTFIHRSVVGMVKTEIRIMVDGGKYHE